MFHASSGSRLQIDSWGARLPHEQQRASAQCAVSLNRAKNFCRHGNYCRRVTCSGIHWPLFASRFVDKVQRDSTISLLLLVSASAAAVHSHLLITLLVCMSTTVLLLLVYKILAQGSTSRLALYFETPVLLPLVSSSAFTVLSDFLTLCLLSSSLFALIFTASGTSRANWMHAFHHSSSAHLSFLFAAWLATVVVSHVSPFGTALLGRGPSWHSHRPE